MPPSRREMLGTIVAGAGAVPLLGVVRAAAEPAAPPLPAATEAFLAQFEPAWQNLDPQLHAVLRMIYAGAIDAPAPADMTPQQLRAANAGLVFYLTAGAPVLPHIEERLIDVPSGKARVRLYDPGLPAPSATAILIHGGGWVWGSIDTYDGVARQVASHAGMRCLSIEYALAPEHPFPAGLDDCVAAIRWAARDGASLGIDPKRLVLVGDSSGANLCIAAALSLRDAGQDLIRGAALVYGVYSTDLGTPTQKAYGGGAYFISTPEIARYWKDYLANSADRQNPLAVPLLANFAGLPPLFIAAGEFDPLRADSEALVAKAKAAGVDVTWRKWKGMVHGTVSIMGWVDAMGPAMDELGAFLKRTAGG